jgi:branched-chain amino acid transport system substrate-binding protein
METQMSERFSRTASTTLIAGLALTAATFASAADVKVGVISPVTGPVALDGESFRQGATLAAKEINAAGGVLGGTLQLVVEDGECKPNVSASAAQKLMVRDSVPVLVGAHCSPATAAVIPLAEREKVPFVTGISSAPSLTQTRREWFFRLPPTEEMTANAAVPFYLEKLGFKSVAILALNDEWGRQAAEANSKLLSQKGVKVIATEYFLPGESEFGATLTTIKAGNPEALFVASNTREAILIAKKVQELGMKQRLIGVGAWPTNTFIQRAGDAGMGWTVISQYVPTIDTPKNKAFVAEFKKAYNVVPDKYAVSGYDAILVVADAIKRAGKADPDKIRDALEKSNLEVVQGKVSFDDKHQAYTNAVISENRNGGSDVLKTVPTQK